VTRESLAGGLLTPWGEQLDPDHPLPEYPRPQMVRSSALNLNGRWQYAITATEDDPEDFEGTIVVPYSPETLLSGVSRLVTPDAVLHYRRTLVLPAGFLPAPDARALLNFGAVDQWCRVAVNGAVVGEHLGGYLPFTFDVTDALRDGENELRVVVRDPSDTGHLSRGKQRLARGGIWYTPQSGIWQTVWMEAVPRRWIQRLEIVPDLGPDPRVPGAETLRVRVHMAPDRTALGEVAPAQVEVVVLTDGVEVARAAGSAGQPLELALPGARRWSPEDPFLYDLRVRSGADEVRSYAGMRSFGLGPDAAGIPRLLLNGEPYFHAGVLDQGYWSDGGYTAPSDEALVHDIATMKRLGFTMLRKHIKVEPLRWYHHCDRLGMLVWQDMVNGGGRYNPAVISVPAVASRVRMDDRRYRAFARTDAAGREHWLGEMEATIALLGNVVSLAMWVPFNEGWGQFDAAAVCARVRELDPSRTVDHASGWHDQGAGDLTSLHVYLRPFRMPRRRRRTGDRAIALTEYGGYSLRLPEHSTTSREFGYRRFPDPAALADAFTRLHIRQIAPAIAEGLAATVYTQLSDVEDETNGLLTYDRRVLKIDEDVVRAVTSLLRLDPA
jgi:Glycosyl hydrolases family 2, sugar binding domain/Glycosyl hydrolases family 2, TIM barrel domain